MKQNNYSPAYARTLLARGEMPIQSVIIAGLRIVPFIPVRFLPEEMRINGPLSIVENPLLVAVHDSVSVEGCFLLNKCRSLRTIGKKLFVGEDCDLADCEALISIGDNLHIIGHLNLSGCPSSITLPETGQIEGDLILPDNFDKSRIPAGLTIGGKVRVGNSYLN